MFHVNTSDYKMAVDNLCKDRQFMYLSSLIMLNVFVIFGNQLMPLDIHKVGHKLINSL